METMEEIGYNKLSEQADIKQTPTHERNTEIRQETGYNKSSELVVAAMFMKQETGYNKPSEYVEMFLNENLTSGLEMEICQETGYNKHSKLVVGSYVTMN